VGGVVRVDPNNVYTYEFMNKEGGKNSKDSFTLIWDYPTPSIK
jgi:hypothetical protein